MECVRNTHAHETNGTQLHAHKQSIESPEEKRWVLGAELNDVTEDIYLLEGVMWNSMLYDVKCLWPEWTTECEVVQNGVVKKAYGVKWWREIAVWCGNVMVWF